MLKLILVQYLNILTILKKPAELKAIKQLIGYKKLWLIGNPIHIFDFQSH